MRSRCAQQTPSGPATPSQSQAATFSVSAGKTCERNSLERFKAPPATAKGPRLSRPKQGYDKSRTTTSIVVRVILSTIFLRALLVLAHVLLYSAQVSDLILVLVLVLVLELVLVLVPYSYSC
jgi:hypothetical protein